MEIKILGTGCPNCKRLEQTARRAIEEAGIEADLVKITDLDEIMAYPILSTPALVLDEEVKSSGRLPGKDEIVAWLRA